MFFVYFYFYLYKFVMFCVDFIITTSSKQITLKLLQKQNVFVLSLYLFMYVFEQK